MRSVDRQPSIDVTLRLLDLIVFQGPLRLVDVPAQDLPDPCFCRLVVRVNFQDLAE